MTLKEVEIQAMQLSSEDREELAERMWASLEPKSSPEHEALWLEEARRRLEEFEKDRSKAIPAEDVFREAFRRFP